MDNKIAHFVDGLHKGNLTHGRRRELVPDAGRRVIHHIVVDMDPFIGRGMMEFTGLVAPLRIYPANQPACAVFVRRRPALGRFL